MPVQGHMLIREEQLAIELHKMYRASLLAVGKLSESKMHDHGWSLCSKRVQNYFRKRAKLMVKRAEAQFDGERCIAAIEDKLRAQLLFMGLIEDKPATFLKAIERRNDATKKLAAALFHLPIEQQYFIICSFFPLERLEDIANFQHLKTFEE